MNRMKLFILAAVAAFVVTACQPAANTAGNSAAVMANANSMANASRPASAAPPTSDSLVALDKSAFEAWKNKDTKFWNGFISDRFAGIEPTGKVDKAAVLKHFAEDNCEVKNYSLSDEQSKQLGPDAAMITYKATADVTCGGQKQPGATWAATVFVREGSDWKAVYHSETPVPDPNAKPAANSNMHPAEKPAANANANTSASSGAQPKSDANADALLAQEKKAWDAWAKKDMKTIEDWATPDFTAFTMNGRQDRAGAIKTWNEDGCEVKSTTLTDPTSVQLSPDYSLLLFHASVDGKCQGSPVPDEYGATIYQNQAGTWKAVFTMGT